MYKYEFLDEVCAENTAGGQKLAIRSVEMRLDLQRLIALSPLRLIEPTHRHIALNPLSAVSFLL